MFMSASAATTRGTHSGEHFGPWPSLPKSPLPQQAAKRCSAGRDIVQAAWRQLAIDSCRTVRRAKHGGDAN